MTRISTNVASLRGLRNLQKSSDQLNTSLTRLSTGLQINSGKDNPSGLIASETLRLQVTAIEQSIKNSNRANNVIATADSALGEIGGLLNQIRGLVQEGLNSGALSQDEIKANQLQIDTALSAINRISANTTFAGDKLIDGSKAFNTQTSAADAAKLSDFKVNEALFGSSSTIEINATIETAAARGTLNFSGNLTADTTLEVAGSKGQQVLFLGSSSSGANIRDAVNDVTDITGVEARLLNSATLSSTHAAVAGELTVTSAGGDNDVTFTDARTTATQGEFDESISIVFADPNANDANLGVVVSQDANNNYTITVNLATDNNGAITTTADDIAAAIAGDANASALVTAVASEGDGTGAVTAAGTAALTGGADGTSNDVNITDIRESGSEGAIDVVFADPNGNDANLSIAVTSNGDDRTITVNLATDANGNITSTAAEVAAALNADATAAALVFAESSGDDTEAVTAKASTDLTEGETVQLYSTNYGSNEFVDVNVLAGSFDTTLSDFTTSAARDTGTDIVAMINGQRAQGSGLTASVRTATLDASVSFDESSNTDDESATVTVTGGGSLFQIGQEVSAAGQIGIGIEAVNTARLGGITGKLYELGSNGGKSLLDVGPNVQGADLVNIVEEALDRVSTLRGRLGAVQKNVIETNISTLGVALENISEARSQIVDTDFAVETANLTKSQILSQAGISTLSIANQNPQQVLSLLG